MEKITVQIGCIGPGSSLAGDFSRSHQEDLNWLSEVLEISGKRASTLVTRLRNSNFSDGNCSNRLTVDLDCRQLARYVARRQVDDLNKYWKYPHVLEFVEHQENEESPPIELRPGKRRN